MKIFKSIKLEDNIKEDNLLLLYEQKIEERKLELSKLDYLLQSKRKEVVIILEEKKILNEELTKLETAKNNLEVELKKISERLEILIKLEIEEREAALSTQTLIKNEISKKYPLHNDMESMRNDSDILSYQKEKLQNKCRTLKEEEYYLIEVKKEISLSLDKFNHLGEEISAAEERLKVLLDRENTIKGKSYKQFYSDLGLNKANNLFKVSLTKKTKTIQRCAAITKKGERCCKRSLPKSKFCSIHSNLLQ